MTDDIARPFELPHRRFSIGETWPAPPQLAGIEKELSFTYGFDAQGRVREVFCNCFKSGEQIERHAQILCMDISHTLQYGSSVSSLAASYRKVPKDAHVLYVLQREIVQHGVAVERACADDAREVAAVHEVVRRDRKRAVSA